MPNRSSLRLLLPALLVLPLAYWSCQRHPAAETPAVIAPDAAPSYAGAATPADAGAPGAAAADRATATAAEQAASALHAYLGALPGADRSRADAYWTGGNPGTPAGDALLRGIPDLRSMRILNDAPVALDRQSPPRAFEIPVRLRLETGTGQARLQGWYRLRTRIEGQGWEITSASLQPALD
ncbi:hypothetical protein MNQ95_12310 [Pseudoxanthomonas daejeonensis]|uniref:hypothetical protein n=1 Tax=Pseudoxanthomonas daejeonensis TaxID=266062 RepID=UPI001F543647|nr:hypothetical protein [Pseudoxanthomonas daejeonensis]UNK56921.1 hypothetical protein MNQ95_12310 [Pseudoxanthomonas daejeonensis]